MITVQSLLEGRNDNYNLTKMIRAFPLDILKVNMVNIYKGYKELYHDYYGKDIFNHYQSQPEDEEEEYSLNNTEID